MFGALFSFLGGSVFRMIWGEVSAYVTKKQDHANGLSLLKLQDEVNGNQFERELEKAKVFAELGIKEIEAKTESALLTKDADAFTEAMKTINSKIDVPWVDAWNGIIRPLAATTAILLWWFCLYTQGFVLGEWDKELVGVILGFYFAHRVFINKK